MTEKRYNSHIDECGVYYYIYDEKEILAESFDKDDAEAIVDKLNEQDSKIKHLERERCTTQKQHLKWSEQAETRIKDLKETIIKITIAYQRKHDNTIVNLVDEVWEEDISGLIKEYGGDVE